LTDFTTSSVFILWIVCPVIITEAMHTLLLCSDPAGQKQRKDSYNIMITSAFAACLGIFWQMPHWLGTGTLAVVDSNRKKRGPREKESLEACYCHHQNSQFMLKPALRRRECQQWGMF